MRKFSQFFPEAKDLAFDGEDIIVTVPLAAAAVDAWAYVAPFACKVTSIREIHSVVGSTSAAVRPRKVTDTSAPGASASTTVKELTGAFDLTAVINTTQVGTLVAAATPVSASDYWLAAGDKIGLDFSGTLTGLVGLLEIHLRRV